ncbi:hypothetical protein AeNC1_008034, partial [Aphanomyces euteiches]
GSIKQPARLCCALESHVHATQRPAVVVDAYHDPQRVDLLLNNFEFNGCGVQDIKYLGENVVCVETSLKRACRRLNLPLVPSTAGHLVAIVVLFAVIMGGGAFYLSKRAKRRRAESLETCPSACFDGTATPMH